MVSIFLEQGGKWILNLPEYFLMHSTYPASVFTFESDFETVVILGNSKKQNPNQALPIQWFKAFKDGSAVVWKKEVWDGQAFY